MQRASKLFTEGPRRRSLVSQCLNYSRYNFHSRPRRFTTIPTFALANYYGRWPSSNSSICSKLMLDLLGTSPYDDLRYRQELSPLPIGSFSPGKSSHSKLSTSRQRRKLQQSHGIDDCHSPRTHRDQVLKLLGLPNSYQQGR